MKGREVGRAGGNVGNPTADLLVCFPSRAHLTLMPKPICSPSRSSKEPSKRRHHHQRSRGQASPLFRTKPNKPNNSEISEPTSPKVTCAGQIKVRPKHNSSASSCKNWQSVMEEIEKIHNNGQSKNRRKPTWLDSVGFKKDIMQFLTALRSLRFDLRCFGSFNGSVVDSDTSSVEEEEEDEEQEERGSSPSKTIFSKWFMVLQENQSAKEKRGEERTGSDENGPEAGPVAPPPNALLLMRCRSAPAKGWLDIERRGGGVDEEKEREREGEKENVKKILEEEEKKKLVLMSYAPDFFKVSSDIAKETWIVGRRDPFSRSRSWKR